MSISELSVRRPVLMTMVYIAILLIALVFIGKLETALYPSVDLPVITVIAECGSYGPEEIVQQVVKPMENSFYSLENLNTMTSQASTGMAYVVLQFNYGTDLDDVEDKINSNMTFVNRSFPDWVSSTSVIRMDSISMGNEVMTLNLSGNKSLDELKQYAEDTIEPILSRVDGVSDVSVRGGREAVYKLQIDPERLYAYNLSLSSVSSALSDRNAQQYIGKIEQDQMEYQISTDSRFTNVKDIEDTIVSGSGDTIVRVSDLGNVYLSEDRSSRSYFNGNEIVSLSVSNNSDSSATAVAKSLKAKITELQKELPEGIVLNIGRDSTQMIATVMNEVYSSAFLGVALAAIVIFLFLRNLKATIIISLSMPICIAFTLMLMGMFDITINSLSLAGLILAIGMIVDASIIILENTYSYREKGYAAPVSAILGSRNMIASIMASTLTTVCVFLPLLLYKYDLEIIGIMMQDMIITICAALMASLFVSVTLVPALGGSILRINTRKQKPLRFAPFRALDNVMSGIEESMRKWYSRILSYFLDHRSLLIMLVVLLLVLSIVGIGDLGFSLMPDMSSNDTVSISLTMPEGTVSDKTLDELFRKSEQIKDVLPEGSYSSMSLRLGGGMMGSSSTNSGTITLNLPDLDDQKYSAHDVQNKIREIIDDNPEAKWSFGSGRGAMSSSSAVDINIESEDDNLIRYTSEALVSLLKTKTNKLIDVTSDASNGSPKISMKIDYDLAKELGVSMANLRSTLYMAINGYKATEITTFDVSTTYDLKVTLNDYVGSMSDLQSVTVPSTQGPVRLDQIADFEYTTSPKSITREDKVRVVHVTANAADGVAANEAKSIAQQIVEENFLTPEGVTLNYTGQMADFQKYMKVLIKVILLALALVYMVMAAQFESLMNPFIIFITIPLLLIGVVGIHAIMGMQFTLFSVVGIIALIGVVVNNGIVLIDSIEQLVHDKMPVREACLEAAKNRLRPILMTTLTTVLGLVPMCFFPGEGTEMLQPIALTFFGGLITGAFLTLLLSPVLYYIINRRKEKHYDDENTLVNILREYDEKGAIVKC